MSGRVIFDGGVRKLLFLEGQLKILQTQKCILT